MEEADSQPEGHRFLAYQDSFNANGICREVVLVNVKMPAELVWVPSGFKITRLSLGEVKLGRFRILKNSARNCALNASETLRIGMFLNKEKSKSTKPGLISEFRPAFPNRVLTFGAAKHCNLTYPLASWGFTGFDPQPGAITRSGY